jgi:hypothetical protein
VIFNNVFSGTIPTEFRLLKQLVFYGVNNNVFTGPISNGIESLTNFVLVNLGGNQFTGTISRDIFLNNHRYLTSFAVSNNCLHGSIPIEICNATRLSALSMDGMNTGTSCRDVIISPGIYQFEAFRVKNVMTGTIPSCLFSKLPHVELISISGNGFTGSLPNHLNVLPSSLISLSLSHNLLEGTIPFFFPQHNNWYSLDLSFNRFTGTLNDWDLFQPLDDPRKGNVSIALNLNRLSGKIPSTLMALNKINILRGNAFTCSDLKRDLPNNDPDMEKYHCGSNSTNTSFYVYILGWALPLIIFLILAFWPKWTLLHTPLHIGEVELTEKCQEASKPAEELEMNCKVDSTALVSTIGVQQAANKYWNSFTAVKLTIEKLLDDWYEMRLISNVALLFDDTITTNSSSHKWSAEGRGSSMLSKVSDIEISKFFDFLKAFRHCVFEITMCIVLLLLPLYIVLSVYFGTHYFDYAWLLSAVWISGVIPGVILTCCFIGVITYTGYTLRAYVFAFHHSSAIETQWVNHSWFRAFWLSIKRWTTNACLWSGFYLIDFVLMLVVDASYVYIYLQFSGGVLLITQIAISAFKMLWNDKLCIQLLLWYKKQMQAWLRYYNQQFSGDNDSKSNDSSQSEYGEHNTLLTNKDLIKLSLLVIKNKIVIPCIVTMIISSSCFYEVFAQTNPVTANAKYCFPIKFLGIPCESILSSTVNGVYRYTPPFVYSFECSSAFIRYYSPVYVFMFIGNLLVPCCLLILKKWYDCYIMCSMRKKNGDRAISYQHFPSLLRPILHCIAVRDFSETDIDELAKKDVVFRCLQMALPLSWYAHLPHHFDRLQRSVTSQQVLVLRLMTALATMLVFGVIFPPLAILACISIICSTLLEEIFFKRLLLRAKALNHRSFIHTTRWNCRVLISSFKESIKSTIGDEIGGKRAQPACILILVVMTLQNLHEQIKLVSLRMWNWMWYSRRHTHGNEDVGSAVANVLHN